MAAPSLATEVSAAGNYPANRFNQRERKLLESVKTYVDSLSPDTVITAQGDIIIGNASGNAARLAKGSNGLPLVAGASTVSYAELTGAGLADDAVSIEHLDDGILPSHIVKFAGQPTTVGGAAAEAITVTGALVSDLVFVQMVDDGTNNVTIVNAVVTADTLTVTFSADPGNDCIINYQILRAAA